MIMGTCVVVLVALVVLWPSEAPTKRLVALINAWKRKR